MKSRRYRLSKLSIKSFITCLEAETSNSIKGAGTEDNTVIFGSIQSCKNTIEPIISSGENVCLRMPN